jgi:tRNA (cytidine/uridine-2'-O-)-methyltransferase
MKHSHQRVSAIKYQWPDRPFHIALVEPEIPPNTGNIARLCAATGSVLHLVGQLGFKMTDRQLKRAGLDYWDSVNMVKHVDFAEFMEAISPGVPLNTYFFSTKGQRLYTDVKYRPGDALVFGSETKGLPDEILDAYPDNVLTIPIRTDAVRSLNLATSVGIVLYEALRQVGKTVNM